MARPGRPGGEMRAEPATPSPLTMLAGSVTVLLTAGLAGGALAFLSKAACRAGAWNTGIGQFQAHCYTDIYPLYFTEQLAAGKVPYLGHPVEYPVLIGAAMQAAAWVVRPISDAAIRGREFFDVTAGLLVIFAVAAVLATAYLAGPARRWTALLVALSPAVILAAFINWDLIAMSLATLGLAAWAGRRCAAAGLLLGLAVATKFYPVFLLGPLLLLCLRAGRMRAFWVTAGSAAAAWLAVNLPVAIVAPAGWATFYRFNAARGADWGSIWYFFQTEHWPVLGSLPLGAINALSRDRIRARLRGDRAAGARRAAAAQAAAAVLPCHRGIPALQQGLVAAVRDLARAARGAGQTAAGVLRALAGGRDRLLLRASGPT